MTKYLKYLIVLAVFGAILFVFFRVQEPTIAEPIGARLIIEKPAIINFDHTKNHSYELEKIGLKEDKSKRDSKTKTFTDASGKSYKLESTIPIHAKVNNNFVDIERELPPMGFRNIEEAYNNIIPFWATREVDKVNGIVYIKDSLGNIIYTFNK